MNEETKHNFKSPLTELIDDGIYTGFDKRNSALNYDMYLGKGMKEEIRRKARENLIRDIRENKPGCRIYDVAFKNAAVCLGCENAADDACIGPNKANVGLKSWTRINAMCQTPQELGVSKYRGSPAEASKIVKRVAREIGAFRVGITGLDRRHVYSHDCDGKEILFESVDEPYETDSKRFIPDKCRYVVVMIVTMPASGFACTPHQIGSAIPWVTYKKIDVLLSHVAHFIRGLGYTAIPSSNDTAPNGPFAVEAGLGEQGRADKVINPTAGALIRICKVITDLPMELDSPQTFGIARFCQICNRCVEACPVNTINEENEESFHVPGKWTNPGHKTWHGNNPLCWAYAEQTSGSCGICVYVCPWNKPDTFFFRIIKGIIKRTSLFNRVFLAADKLFGYGKLKNPESWWDL